MRPSGLLLSDPCQCEGGGKTTDTLPAAKGLYIPLKTSRGIVGLHPSDPQLLIAPERLHLLEALTDQIALAVE